MKGFIDGMDGLEKPEGVRGRYVRKNLAPCIQVCKSILQVVTILHTKASITR